MIDTPYATVSEKIAYNLNLDSSKGTISLIRHWRENFGQPLRDIFQAILDLGNRNSDVEIVYPVNPNPNASALATEMFATCNRVIMCQPLDFGPFVAMMKASYLILADSEGVQEEARALDKPVPVLQLEAQRPEALNEGVVKLFGTYQSRIVEEAEKLLNDKLYYKSIVNGVSPYGDGLAAARIGKRTKALLNVAN